MRVSRRRWWVEGRPDGHVREDDSPSGVVSATGASIVATDDTEAVATAARWA
jgi:hypothetical protein